MPSKITVQYQGREIEGTRFDYTTIKEDWNEYKLENGSILRLRVVPVEFVVTGEKNEAGDTVVVVKSSVLVHYNESKE